eukprot:231316-Hanusia_phi.AAC.1
MALVIGLRGSLGLSDGPRRVLQGQPDGVRTVGCPGSRQIRNSPSSISFGEQEVISINLCNV